MSEQQGENIQQSSEYSQLDRMTRFEAALGSFVVGGVIGTVVGFGLDLAIVHLIHPEEGSVLANLAKVSPGAFFGSFGYMHMRGRKENRQQNIG